MTVTSRRWLLGLCLLSACGGGAEPSPEPVTPPAETREDPPLPFSFTDEATARGLDVVNHCGSPTNKRYLLEEIGQGCALYDLDGDGDLDAFLVDACTLTPPPEGSKGDWLPAMDGQCRLYENDGHGRFEDITEAAGVGYRGFGQGVSIADYDNDGDPDLYLTCWGENLLYRNEGVRDGTVFFQEVAAEAGVADPYWSVGSCWLDAEGDGDLDLYVVNYFAMALKRDPDCWRKVECPYQGTLTACGPKGMIAEPDRFYENQGDGTFRDRSRESGILGVEARYGLGATTLDYDLDGDVDIYVANDSRGNFLFENDGSGRFLEMADLTGTSLSRGGLPQAGMGVACGDFDGDLDPDLFLTNFSHDYNTLYRNEGGLDFLDVTRRIGFSEVDYFSLGWGTAFLDLDHDGDLDLFVCNGHVYPEADQRGPELSYKQLNRVYVNEAGRVRDVTAQAGPGLTRRASSRGMAVGDVDNDGDLDALIVDLNERPTLLIQEHRGAGHWLQVSLEGVADSRDAVGARVVAQIGASSQVREVRRGGSFASCHDPRLHFGTGAAQVVDRLEIRWPNGEVQVLVQVTADRWIHVTQGRDEPEERR